MKNIATILLSLLFITAADAQTPPKRIKIILLGTFHFNQSLDSSSKLHSNLFTGKRQKEVEMIVDKLTAQKPDKIFLEFTEQDQSYYDSIYNNFLNGKEPEGVRTKANEIFQLGMKTAKKLGHKQVFGMNYQPEELANSNYKPRNEVDRAIKNLYTSLSNFTDSARTNARFYDLPFPYKLPKQDSLLQKVSLLEYLLFLNSPQKLQKAEYEEWNYFLSMGGESDMSSTDYVGTFWYGTNLRNYNNVMRKVDYKNDKCYLIIYGANHIPFLQYLFNQNPYFDVVNLEQVLK